MITPVNKNVRIVQLADELISAGLVCRVYGEGSAGDGVAASGLVSHDGLHPAEVQTAIDAHVPAPSPEKKLLSAQITNIISALEAGTATGAQVQSVLAKVLRYLRKENF